MNKLAPTPTKLSPKALKRASMLALFAAEGIAPDVADTALLAAKLAPLKSEEAQALLPITSDMIIACLTPAPVEPTPAKPKGKTPKQELDAHTLGWMLVGAPHSSQGKFIREMLKNWIKSSKHAHKFNKLRAEGKRMDAYAFAFSAFMAEVGVK